VVSGEISSKLNYEIEIAKFLKARKKILHYKEINEFIFSKYKTIRNAVNYLNNFSECVKVAPGFYAHRDMITNEFYSQLDSEKKQINKVVRKEVMRKNEVPIDNLASILFDLQIGKLFSENDLRHFISNASNLDDDLKRSCFPSSKKFVLKHKSDECGHNKERVDTEEISFKSEVRLKDKQKDCGLHIKIESLKEKSQKIIMETELSDLGLSIRSTNCILNTPGLSKIRDLILFTEDALLRVGNFGKKELNEMKEVLGLLGLRLGMTTADIADFEAHHGATPTEILSSAENNIYSPLERKISGFNLSVRSGNCLQSANVKNIRELIQYTESDLLKRRNFGRKSLREIKSVLKPMGLRLGMTTEEIEDFEVHNDATPTKLLSVNDSKTDANTLFEAVPWMIPVVARFLLRIIVDERASVGEALSVKGPKGSETRISDTLSSIGFKFFGDIYDEVYESLPEHLQIIAKKRAHTYSPLSLDNLGTEFGLTRERVRQIEIKVEDKFATRFKQMDVAVQSRVMRATLGKVVPLRSARSLAKNLVNSSRHPELAFFAFLQLIGPYKAKNNWIVRSDALDRVNSLKSIILDQADRIGRIDPFIIGRETAGLFRQEGERDLFLLEYLNLQRIFDEWVKGLSQRRRVFLSLYKIGKPATKEEIANYAGIDDPSRVGSYLGGNDFICRADKERWAFIEWVDDPYEGIVREIEQRIEEDGGKTTLEKILTELPSKFGVAEASVSAYLASPKFIVKDGYVKCATQDEINSTYFGDVEDVSTAVRLEDGSWGVRIKVEERFLAGYSATIPAPIAWECGLEPGDSVLVPVDGTKYTVSLIWRVNNLLKTIDLGRIAPVLREFGLKQGDDIVVVPSIYGVRIFRAEEAPIMDPCDQEDTADPVNIESLMKVLFKR
jgi:hypothetical protein